MTYRVKNLKIAINVMIESKVTSNNDNMTASTANIVHWNISALDNDCENVRTLHWRIFTIENFLQRFMLTAHHITIFCNHLSRFWTSAKTLQTTSIAKLFLPTVTDREWSIVLSHNARFTSTHVERGRWIVASFARQWY